MHTKRTMEGHLFSEDFDKAAREEVLAMKKNILEAMADEEFLTLFHGAGDFDSCPM